MKLMTNKTEKYHRVFKNIYCKKINVKCYFFLLFKPLNITHSYKLYFLILIHSVSLCSFIPV